MKNNFLEYVILYILVVSAALTHIAAFQFINVKKTVPNGQKLACL
jgi:hypothetical protein